MLAINIICVGKLKEKYMIELVNDYYKRINKSPAVFDMVKLRWMNGEYIKAMDNEKFYEMALPYIGLSSR